MEENTGSKQSTDFRLLAGKLKNPKPFWDYIDYIKNFGGLRLDDMHWGYFGENFKIAEMIPEDKMVVDIGCGFGLQHVLYQNHRGYIGIQRFMPFNATSGDPELRVFTDNARFINGYFRDVWEQIGINKDNHDSYFAIANHSLFNSPITNKEDIEIFFKQFKNYYCTDESQRPHYFGTKET